MSGISEGNLSKSKDGMLADLNNRNSLLVSFGGIRQGLGIPVFEFFNSIKEVDCDKIYIRDFNQAWYHMGIDQKITSIDSLKEYLSKIIHSNSYDKICFIGNSMGGYAALLFGNLLNIDSVFSFAPQTFIDRLKRVIFRDKRWKEQIAKVYSISDLNTKYLDLKRQLINNQSKTKYTIFYSDNDLLDKRHAIRLNGITNVKLVAKKEGGHEVVRTLRDSGELFRVLKEAL